ncbi:MAG: heparosan-N-sulfate-glucuronate 5-epimerase [Gaiellaceae bacterium]|jgi:hypothetical protein|nr:heparosan-N-sulfate-glucuronate 5-epimerase [Gaiellaceae bacterium]
MQQLAPNPREYYVDLRGKVTSPGAKGFAELTADPVRANPVSIVQLGLGALQLDKTDLVADVVGWVEERVGADGLLAYRFPMPHTYALEPPWYSALAQGEAVSLLVRAAVLLERPGLVDLAEQIAEPLIRSDSPLVVETPEGPVLQEYPTDPPAHVLNGWLFALWGLHDLGATEAFATGAETLARRIDRYRAPLGWSLYDLYPHPLPNIASPSYHRLHIEQLRRQCELLADPRIAAVADEWERAAGSRVSLAGAFAAKVAFRVVRPRWRRVRQS